MQYMHTGAKHTGPPRNRVTWTHRTGHAFLALSNTLGQLFCFCFLFAWLVFVLILGADGLLLVFFCCFVFAHKTWQWILELSSISVLSPPPPPPFFFLFFLFVCFFCFVYGIWQSSGCYSFFFFFHFMGGGGGGLQLYWLFPSSFSVVWLLLILLPFGRGGGGWGVHWLCHFAVNFNTWNVVKTWHEKTRRTYRFFFSRQVLFGCKVIHMSLNNSHVEVNNSRVEVKQQQPCWSQTTTAVLKSNKRQLLVRALTQVPSIHAVFVVAFVCWAYLFPLRSVSCCVQLKGLLSLPFVHFDLPFWMLAVGFVLDFCMSLFSHSSLQQPLFHRPLTWAIHLQLLHPAPVVTLAMHLHRSFLSRDWKRCLTWEQKISSQTKGSFSSLCLLKFLRLKAPSLLSPVKHDLLLLLFFFISFKEDLSCFSSSWMKLVSFRNHYVSHSERRKEGRGDGGGGGGASDMHRLWTCTAFFCMHGSYRLRALGKWPAFSRSSTSMRKRKFNQGLAKSVNFDFSCQTDKPAIDFMTDNN